jgi:hypothetical protein
VWAASCADPTSAIHATIIGGVSGNAIIWMPHQPTRNLVTARLPSGVIVLDRAAFVEAARFVRVAFVDEAALHELDAPPAGVTVIAVCDATLPVAMTWLESRPWLAHVVGAATLTSAIGPRYLAGLVEIVQQGRRDLLHLIGDRVAGRLARVAQSSQRATRLQRITEFMTDHELGRLAWTVRDVTEELLTNALYNAPVTAGMFEQPVARTTEVVLPSTHACEVMYGIHDQQLAYVRVRDVFGSLTRDRLVGVLRRCADGDMSVRLDDSMGGAGLGLWRIFSAGAFVAIDVTPGRSTEFVVGLLKRTARTSANEPLGIHLFFRSLDDAEPAETPANPALLENSVPVVRG